MMLLFGSVGKHIESTMMMMMMFNVMLLLVVVVVVAGERGRGPWLCESSFPARSCGRERENLLQCANFPQKIRRILSSSLIHKE